MREIRETWTARQRDVGLDDLLALAGESPFALLHGRGEWTILGSGAGARIEEPSALRFVRRGEAPPIRPDVIGVIEYDGRRDLRVYGEVAVWHAPTRMLYRATRNLPPGAARRRAAGAGPFTAHKLEDSDPPALYRAKVEAVREEIRRGNVYQVNLTRQERWSAAGDPVAFARRLARDNPAPYSALIGGPGRTIVSSSPECFLTLRDGVLATRPIKGTTARGATPEEDEDRRAALAASAKDRAELTMIVDLCRNDLVQVCDPATVRPRPFPRLVSVADVHHMDATIEGRVAPGLTLERLLAALFPAGSITGCPKIAAMEVIRRLEAWPRGPYTGAIGWLAADLSQLELSVAIRTAVIDDDVLRFGVGGGVVWDSDPAAEYEETVHKSGAILGALRSFAN